MSLYIPDRSKIFEDIDVTEECGAIGCGKIRLIPKQGSLYCAASAHGECPRVNVISAEINQFVSDNDDIFMYLTFRG